MVKRASPELKVFKSHCYNGLFSYPRFYRQEILQAMCISKSVLRYVAALGFKPGRLRVRNLLVLPDFSIFGLLMCQPYRHFCIERSNATSSMLECGLHNSFKYVRIGTLPFLSALVVDTNFLWFFQRCRVGWHLPPFNSIPTFAVFANFGKMSDKHNYGDVDDGFDLNCVLFGRRHDFRSLLFRVFFRLRSEYLVSHYFHFDLRMCCQDYGLLDNYSRRFSDVFFLPFINFRNMFRSVRLRTHMKSIFSGFFFVDFDLVLYQMTNSFRRSRRRQYSYVYRTLPVLVQFSNYYNTLVRGFRLILRGKLGGRVRTRMFVLEDFRPLPGFFLQAFCSGIQYKFLDSSTYTGTFGFHVYVYFKCQYASNVAVLES